MANTHEVLQGVKDYTLELLGEEYRDVAVDAADRAEAQAERAEAAADNAEVGIIDDTIAKQHLTPGLRDELDGKTTTADLATEIATAQRSFSLKLRKDPSESVYWLPVDVPTSLQGANFLRVVLPSKARWRLTARGAAGISLRALRNGAAALTKPLADDDFVGHLVADADDWLLFSFPDETPEDGTEIEVSLLETDAFKADQEAVDAALALKADADHTHTAAQVGARPDTWTPTAQDVGARPDDWVPTAAQVGARPDTWTPTAQDVGAATQSDIDTALENFTSGVEQTTTTTVTNGVTAIFVKTGNTVTVTKYGGHWRDVIAPTGYRPTRQALCVSPLEPGGSNFAVVTVHPDGAIDQSALNVNADGATITYVLI